MPDFDDLAAGGRVMHPPTHPSIHPSITFLPLLKLINRRLASLESHSPLAQSLFFLGGMGWRSNTLSDKIVVHRLHQLPFLWIRIFYDYQDSAMGTVMMTSLSKENEAR